MHLIRRLIVIFTKAGRLIVLASMIRCFGPDGTYCMLAGLQSMRERFTLGCRSLF